MASTWKPTIFFVHGAWHQPSHFAPITKKLQAQGFPVVCPKQPSFDVPSEKMKEQKMYFDATVIRAELQKLVEEEERQVVVVMHSYGGVVGTEAIDASLGIGVRAARGARGGVIRLVYMTAFILPPDASLGDAFGGKLPPFLTEDPDGSCHMVDPRVRFYAELSDDDAAYWLSQTRPHPAIVQKTPLTYTAYLHHPLAYIVCTKDRGLLPEVQRQMIAACEAKGPKFDIYELPADHSPFLSTQDELVTVLEKITATSASM